VFGFPWSHLCANLVNTDRPSATDRQKTAAAAYRPRTESHFGRL
jgi:hypothetical protein